MAKLRKMLGNIQSQECMEMKGLIETQCHHTLSAWAVAFAKESYLPIYAAECGSSCLEDAVAACEAYLAGARMLKDVKPYLRAAAQLARETGGEPRCPGSRPGRRRRLRSGSNPHQFPGLPVLRGGGKGIPKGRIGGAYRGL